jgi:hypothetical protein
MNQPLFGRPIRFCGRSARLERETPIASATLFTGNRPSASDKPSITDFVATDDSGGFVNLKTRRRPRRGRYASVVFLG